MIGRIMKSMKRNEIKEREREREVQNTIGITGKRE